MYVDGNVIRVGNPPDQKLKYDDLNGEDIFQTTVKFTKAATTLGAFLGGTSVVLWTPKTYFECFTKATTTTATLAVMGAVFGLSANASASYREKDDVANYFVGGCASGMILGARTKSIGTGIGSCLGLGSVGLFYKWWEENNFGSFFGKPLDDVTK